MATGGVIFGRKKAVRKKPDARPARSSSSASPSATRTWAGTTIAVNTNVLRSARDTLGSSRSCLKLSRPTNRGSLMTS